MKQACDKFLSIYFSVKAYKLCEMTLDLKQATQMLSVPFYNVCELTVDGKHVCDLISLWVFKQKITAVPG